MQPSIGRVGCTGNRTRCGGVLRAAFIVFVCGLLAGACSSRNNPATVGNAFDGDATATARPSSTPTPTPTPLPADPAEARAVALNLQRQGSYDEAANAYRAAATAATVPDDRAQDTLGAAVATYSNGDIDGAIALLREALAAAPAGGETARRAAYLLAVRLDESGAKPQEAVGMLQPFAAAANSDALEAYIRTEYARALDATGDSTDANTTWDGVLATPGIPTSLRQSVYDTRLAAARARSDTVATRDWLARLASLTDDPGIRYELAGLAFDAGDGATFLAQLTAIISNDPGSSFATRAVADLENAGVAVDPGSEGYVDYRRGLYADAISVLSAAIADPGVDPATLAFRQFYLAAAYEDSGALDDAIAGYDAVAALGANSPYTHRAMYWAARVVERQGDSEAASRRYVALVLDGPSGEFTAEAAFRAGYTLLSGGDAAGAIVAWTQLGASSDARLLYWEGRAYTLLGNTASASASYALAAAAAPLDFYGQEAARANGSLGPVNVSYRPRMLSSTIDWTGIATWLATQIPGIAATSPVGADALASIGMESKARDVIWAAASSAGAWRLLDLAHQAKDAGLPDVAAQLAVQLRQATGVAPEKAPKALLQLAYPVDYVELLQQASQSNGLDALFVAAVVRQESLWDAGAGSGAGALGLTQVIPPTGQGIADELDVTGFVASDLFRPVVSLKFGAYYLADQLRQYGNPLAALAAYNAGPSNAARWVAAAPPADGAADFAEAVDIGETQHYVQVIMEHYAFYQLAWGP